ncbi:MAG: hypothetical protein J0L55_08105 [Caulobacterales bacterium]|nr:hypothetical protein [Caulobacterales bacterium]MCA0373858.1 hypothetical protein [Pseudomonadota bacterium]
MGNKINVFILLLTIFFANNANAQTSEIYTHISDKTNSYKDTTIIDFGEFNANPNAIFIIRCEDGCTEKYGIKYDKSTERWQILRLDTKPIEFGKKFEIIKENVSKQFVKDGYLQFSIQVSDIVNLCKSAIGISLSPDLTENDKVAKDLEYGLVIFERKYFLHTQSIEMKLGIDRALKEDTSFNILIGKKNNACYNQGDNDIDFSKHEITLALDVLQTRIIDDIEGKPDPKTDASKLKNQKLNFKKPTFPKKPNQ